MSIGFIRGTDSPQITASADGRIYTFENVKSEDTPVWNILKSNNGNGRQSHACAIVNGKMIIAGGEQHVGGSSILNCDTTFLYDIETDSWDGGTAIPEIRTGCACTSYSYNGSDYVILVGGAKTCFDTVSLYSYIYNFSTDTWTATDVAQYRNIHSSCVALGQYVYSIGGQTIYSSGALPTVQRYDIIGGSWSLVASMPAGSTYGTATVVGKYIYVFGGNTGNYYANAQYGAYRYDTELNTWTTLDSLPEARARHAAVAIGNKIYLFGGTSGSNENFYNKIADTIYCYDTETAEWTLLPDRMPAIIWCASAEVYNNKVYIYGGKMGGSLSTQSTSSQLLSFQIKSEPSFEITGENKLLFDKDVLVDGVTIPANTETTITVESATVTFPETTSGTIEPIGQISIN